MFSKLKLLLVIDAQRCFSWNINKCESIVINNSKCKDLRIKQVFRAACNLPPNTD